MKTGQKVKVTSGVETGAVGKIISSIGSWNTVDLGDGKPPSGYFDNELEAIKEQK